MLGASTLDFWADSHRSVGITERDLASTGTYTGNDTVNLV